MKKCCECKKEKLISEFAKNREGKFGVHSKCKECMKAYSKLYHEGYKKKARDGWIRRKYGLTPKEFDELLEEQNNSCAICEMEFTYDTRETSPYVDHDHDNNWVRGILCFSCNTGLGKFQDNAKLLRKAIEYLEDI